MPQPEEGRLLKMPAGTPVMVVVRTAYTIGGMPVELNEMIMDSASYVLQYDFDA